jgi:hypothetical protein
MALKLTFYSLKALKTDELNVKNMLKLNFLSFSIYPKTIVKA